MLDHDEERQLAEIEARLRDEAPDLLELFDTIPDQIDRSPRPDQRGRPTWSDVPRAHLSGQPAVGAGPAPDRRPTGHVTRHPVLKSLTALAVAVVLTTIVTLAVGPNLGGLIAVIGLSAAGMYAYQVLRGCPGLRGRSDDT